MVSSSHYRYFLHAEIKLTTSLFATANAMALWSDINSGNLTNHFMKFVIQPTEQISIEIFCAKFLFLQFCIKFRSSNDMVQVRRHILGFKHDRSSIKQCLFDLSHRKSFNLGRTLRAYQKKIKIYQSRENTADRLL